MSPRSTTLSGHIPEPSNVGHTQRHQDEISFPQLWMCGRMQKFPSSDRLYEGIHICHLGHDEILRGSINALSTNIQTLLHPAWVSEVSQGELYVRRMAGEFDVNWSIFQDNKVQAGTARTEGDLPYQRTRGTKEQEEPSTQGHAPIRQPSYDHQADKLCRESTRPSQKRWHSPEMGQRTIRKNVAVRTGHRTGTSQRTRPLSRPWGAFLDTTGHAATGLCHPNRQQQIRQEEVKEPVTSVTHEGQYWTPQAGQSQSSFTLPNHQP